ncbi:MULTISPECIES: hypothetical protein [unclassified Bradyrhizobium]|uniref:hypothetical protein n=1 Tax=unclassified Bradyrhizobium TaxID=2631580 RepID=UPI001CD70C29|nr:MULTISPECIES: hypothetical protein [unclassified Bradyrhizobium]
MAQQEACTARNHGGFAGLFLKKPVACWLAKLKEAVVSPGPINDFEQVLSDRHVQSGEGGSSLRS